MDLYIDKARRGATVFRDYSLQALVCSGKFGKHYAISGTSSLHSMLLNWRKARVESKENDGVEEVYEFLGCKWLLEDIYTLTMMWFTTLVFLALHVAGIHPASFAIALGTLWIILKCDDVLIPALQESVQDAEYGRHAQLFVDELIDRKILLERVIEFFSTGVDYLRSVSSTGFACLALLVGLFILRLGQTFGFGLLLYTCSIMFCLLPYINRVVRASTESLWQALEQAEESATQAEGLDDYLPTTSTASLGTGTMDADDEIDLSERSEFERQLNLHAFVPAKVSTTIQSVDKFNSIAEFMPYSTVATFGDTSVINTSTQQQNDSLAVKPSLQPPQLVGKPISGLNFLMSHFSTPNASSRDAEDDDDDADNQNADDDKENSGSDRSYYRANSTAAERLREQNRRQIEQRFVVPSAPPEQLPVDDENVQQSSPAQKVVRRKKVLLQPNTSSASSSDDATDNTCNTDEDFEVIDALDETSADLHYPRLSTFGDYDALLKQQQSNPASGRPRSASPKVAAARVSEGKSPAATATTTPTAPPQPHQWLWG